MNRKTQKKVFGREAKGIRDVLEGFRIGSVMIEDRKYPNIVSSKGNYVKGLVIFVKRKELSVIDKYETKAYKRIRVTTKNRRKVWVYQATQF